MHSNGQEVNHSIFCTSVFIKIEKDVGNWNRNSEEINSEFILLIEPHLSTTCA